jgi:hypothetical protein
MQNIRNRDKRFVLILESFGGFKVCWGHFLAGSDSQCNLNSSCLKRFFDYLALSAKGQNLLKPFDVGKVSFLKYF